MLNKMLNIILAGLCCCIALISCEQGNDNDAPTWSDGGVTEEPIPQPDEEQEENDETQETDDSEHLDDGGIWTDRYK